MENKKIFLKVFSAVKGGMLTNRDALNDLITSHYLSMLSQAGSRFLSLRT
jgi:hypothetical protein